MPINYSSDKFGVKIWDIKALAKKYFEAKAIEAQFFNPTVIGISSLIVTASLLVVMTGLLTGVLLFPPIAIVCAIALVIIVKYIAIPILVAAAIIAIIAFKDECKLSDLPAIRKELEEKSRDNLNFLRNANTEFRQNISDQISKIDNLEVDLGIPVPHSIIQRRKNFADLLDVINNKAEILKKTGVTCTP